MFRQKKRSQALMQEAALAHLDVLYGTALRMCKSQDQAEDLIQETYMRAVRFHNKFEPGSNLKAWLFRMMTNLFINSYRRRQRTLEVQHGHQRLDLLERMTPDDQLMAATAPQEYFFEKFFSDEVVCAIEDLPHNYKMVLLMADVNDFSYAQISQILDIPIGTVMSRLHRGRKILRAALYLFAIEEGYIKPRTDDKELHEKVTNLTSFRQRKSREGSK